MIRTEKEVITKEVNIYYTSDGNKFTDYDEAERHEQHLEEQNLIQMTWPFCVGDLTIVRSQREFEALERKSGIYAKNPEDFPCVCVTNKIEETIVEMPLGCFQIVFSKILEVVNAEIERAKENSAD